MGLLHWLRWKLSGPGTRKKMVDESLRDWRIVTVENEEFGSMVMKLRLEKPPIALERGFRGAVLIEWSYGAGIPDTAVTERMYELEAGIEELMFDNGFSEFVLGRTGLGKRDWLFYTSDKERFMARFNALLAGHAPYPIHIELMDDPGWAFWHDTRDAVVAKGVPGDPVRSS